MYSLDVEAQAAAILGGAATSIDVDGRMIVPPSAAVSLHVVASSVAELFTVGFHWSEIQLDLG